MNFVYILQSLKNSNKFCIGICSNLKNRLKEHNSGECRTTSTYKPWIIKNAFYFSTEGKATDFEKYLKSGSGRSFAKRHF